MTVKRNRSNVAARYSVSNRKSIDSFVGFVVWFGVCFGCSCFGVVHQFERRSITPQAFANFSPTVGAQRQPWVNQSKNRDQP